ncbi:MAG: DegT/DnrJ/EryC1/StrS family aminotransferase [Candidatus Thorarchaeota archaeon]|jgi:perosamine synthetase
MKAKTTGHISGRTRAEMIPWGKPCLGEREREYLLKAMDSTWISAGEFVDRFESDFARLIGTKHAVTTSSGTTALHLALLALGVGPGDEVIVPAFTFVSPANMVIETGAKPVYADIDPKTWCVDVKEVERSVTEQTKAIVAVHVYGNVCDMETLTRIAGERQVYLIEDAAEAACSRYRGRLAGSFGQLGCFSFQATKTITMGEGGAVVTDDKKLSERVRIMRSHGMRQNKRYWHDLVGYNYRLTNLQAAVGCAQLENLDNIMAEKARIHARYSKSLSGLSGIELQHIPKDVEPVMWAVALRMDQHRFKVDRDSVIAELLNKNIETRPGFYPFSAMPFYKAKPLPIAESISRNVISLPSYISISDDDIDYICHELKGMMK